MIGLFSKFLLIDFFIVFMIFIGMVFDNIIGLGINCFFVEVFYI